MRQILHIDMNSYFATVEQQANPQLRGKPVAVLGSHAKRTIIVAASVDAKKFGVKTGTRVEDAPKLCPNIVFVHGEPRKYAWVTKKFIEIFESYTDKVEIFSIDEAFLDVTSTAKLYSPRHSELVSESGTVDTEILKQVQDDVFVGALAIAHEIKRRIREEIGEYISCSVGVASNKFLAKTASDLMKPDGLVVVTFNPKSAVIPAKAGNQKRGAVKLDSSFRWNDEERGVRRLTVDEMLLNLPLSEYCGIGGRIHQRLGAIGIHTTADLRKVSNVILNKEFGIATGEKLKRMASGLDSAPVISWHDRADAKSFSHSRTLNKDVTNHDEIRKHILLLSEKVARHLRKDGYFGREVGLWIRFKDFSGAGKSRKISKWTHDGAEIAGAAQRILKTLDLRQPVRAIGVYVGTIQSEKNITISLLPEDATNDKILRAMDAVNDRFGEDVVTRARLTGTKIKEIVSGMGRDKF